jgi:hypothetical protein
MEDFGWVLVIGLLVFLFAGDPDLHDKIIASFDAPTCAVQPQASGGER